MKKYFILGICLLLGISNARAQVTIGSDKKPVTGALLELNNLGTDASVNSTKGLMLPRVKLSDLAKLKMGTADELLGNEREGHKGLTVYHLSDSNNPLCEQIPSGVYTWTGSEWIGIGTPEPETLRINKLFFDLPSSKDARPYRMEDMIINWYDPATTFTKTFDVSKFPELKFTNNPLPTTLTPSPATIGLLPDVLKDTEYKANPWTTKRSALTFTSMCGNAEVILNQTNYAVKANGELSSMNIDLDELAAHSDQTFQIQSNAKWRIELENYDNAITNTSLTTGDIGGEDSYDGETKTITFSYKVGAPAAQTKYISTVLKIIDTQTPKRFDDFHITFMKCGGEEYSLREWATRQGTAKNEIDVNGVAWHEDQDNNVFFSANFGDAGRWMTTDLRALTYDPIRTDGKPRPSTVPIPKRTSIGAAEIWYILAGNEPASFMDKNPRVGYAYSWQAATGTLIADRVGRPEEWNVPIDNIQGICPNGWHLPSSYEAWQLVNELHLHSSKYSSKEDDLTPIVPQWNYRGEQKVVEVFCEMCNPVAETPEEHPWAVTAGGVSKQFNAGGFAFPISGWGINDVGQQGGIWLSSAAGFGPPHLANYAEYLAFTPKSAPGMYDSLYQGGMGFTGSYIKNYSMMVRCKKD